MRATRRRLRRTLEWLRAADGPALVLVTLVVGLLVFLGIGGCPAPGGGGEDAAGIPADGGDAGPPDVSAPPLRQLTSRSLFGAMPVDNHVFDPQFSLLDGTGWMAYSQLTYDLPLLNRVFTPDTPGAQPALKLPKAGNPAGYVTLGLVKSTAGPIAIAIWVGREAGAADTALDLPSLSLIGYFEDGGVSNWGVPLQRDETVEPIELGDFMWRRFSAVLDDGPVGWGYLYVDDGAPSDLYLTSPMLVTGESVPGLRARFAGLSQTARRPLRPAEQAGLVAATALLKERLQAPARERMASPRAGALQSPPTPLRRHGR